MTDIDLFEIQARRLELLRDQIRARHERDRLTCEINANLLELAFIDEQIKAAQVRKAS